MTKQVTKTSQGISDTITFEALDEEMAQSIAKSRARSRFGNEAVVKSLQLTASGRKGLLGIGRKYNQYTAEIFLPKEDLSVTTVTPISNTSKDIAALIAALRYQGDTAVRAEAAGSLGQLGDKQAVLPLIDVLQYDSDPYVRSVAAQALGELGDSRAKEALMDCLANDIHQVSLKAGEALFKIH
ncbi:MAG TPA: HEAT repeat domain-containing protein [Anaerolineae bacterium]|nr:HEAT repeat domain-containing protein [Anaerolineae bacterium]